VCAQIGRFYSFLYCMLRSFVGNGLEGSSCTVESYTGHFSSFALLVWYADIVNYG